MSSSSLDCAVIILSYNNLDILPECIDRASVAAQKCMDALHNRVEIIVVDNASTDGSVEYVRTHYPEVRLIANATNGGCAIASNQGMSTSNASFFLHLNSDTFINPDTLLESLRWMQTHPTSGVLAARVTYADGSFQPNCGFLPTPVRTITWALGLDSVPGINRWLTPFYQHDPHFYTHTQSVGWCTTCFFVLRREVYESVGGIDESLVVHMEDVEWCQRITQAGYTITLEPSIMVTHLGGKSTKRFSQGALLSQHLHGLWVFHHKHYPASWWMVRTALTLGMGMRSLAYLLLGRLQMSHAYGAAVCLLICSATL